MPNINLLKPTDLNKITWASDGRNIIKGVGYWKTIFEAPDIIKHLGMEDQQLFATQWVLFLSWWMLL